MAFQKLLHKIPLFLARNQLVRFPSTAASWLIKVHARTLIGAFGLKDCKYIYTYIYIIDIIVSYNDIFRIDLNIYDDHSIFHCTNMIEPNKHETYPPPEI